VATLTARQSGINFVVAVVVDMARVMFALVTITVRRPGLIASESLGRTSKRLRCRTRTRARTSSRIGRAQIFPLALQIFPLELGGAVRAPPPQRVQTGRAL
jgi:hypothetical protein